MQKMHHIKAKRQRRNEFSVGPFRISDIAEPTFAKRTPDCLITRPSFISCNKGQAFIRGGIIDDGEPSSAIPSPGRRRDPSSPVLFVCGKRKGVS